ncbi:hypothetical protein L484_016043 [Morus notabilis]|uniref:Uncharacterized protein n=1 Tax=Morus notabilis TaxID=981085 RepID=W9RNH3_9ROSA|nr:hypothetical protein L484_016043 [Morus notabilis]
MGVGNCSSAARNGRLGTEATGGVAGLRRRPALEEDGASSSNRMRDGSVTEGVLEILEILEELDRSQGNAILDSMRAAYCMVAFECTVKFLVSSGGKPRGKYSKALNRIWRGRIGRLETYGKSELVSAELKKRWDEVNSVFDAEEACRKLCGMNTRNDALFSIRLYLEEAWGLVGPSFLELADGLMNKKKRVLNAECDRDELDDLDEQNLAALILLNLGEGLRLSEELCKEDDVYNSKITDVQCLAVQTLTTVELCDPLCVVETVISDLQLKDVNSEQPLENQSGDQEVDEANPSTELAKCFDINIQKKVLRTSFLERNSTVRTCEKHITLNEHLRCSPDGQQAKESLNSTKEPYFCQSGWPVLILATFPFHMPDLKFRLKALVYMNYEVSESARNQKVNNRQIKEKLGLSVLCQPSVLCIAQIVPWNNT